MKLSSFLIIISFLVMILAACDSRKVYEENVTLESGKWNKDDIKSFEFIIDDISSQYNIYYYVRNAVSYPFHNLYLKYTLKGKNNKMLKAELQNMHLFDEKTGKPLGSGLGDIFDLKILSIEKFQFPDTGQYTFEIQQYMRRDTLSDILAIGIRVEKFKE